jgi:7 transmembrane receptor (rhodopsin family)
MFVAYGRIAVTLWRRTPPGEQLESDISSEASAKRLAERKRIVRMLVIIVGLFTLSWFPFFTAQVVNNLRTQQGFR